MLNSVSNVRKLDTVRFKGFENEYTGNISSPYIEDIEDSFEYTMSLTLSSIFLLMYI